MSQDYTCDPKAGRVTFKGTAGHVITVQISRAPRGGYALAIADSEAEAGHGFSETDLRAIGTAIFSLSDTAAALPKGGGA